MNGYSWICFVLSDLKHLKVSRHCFSDNLLGYSFPMLRFLDLNLCDHGEEDVS